MSKALLPPPREEGLPPCADAHLTHRRYHQTTTHGNQREEGRAMANPNQHARDGKGHYIRTPATAERDAKAAELRAQGWTFEQIADHLGFHDRSGARLAIRRALKEIVQEPAEKLLVLEAQRLDTLYEEALEVLQRDHLTVSHGKIITTTDPETGEEKPLLDDGPKLAAIDRLVKVRESYRRLLGIDRPVKVERTDAKATLADLLAATEPGTGDAGAG